MRILSIVGARPQFIKAATVSRAIHQHPELSEILVHTGQHFDDNMSEVFFREMQIPKPAINLNINSLGHGAMTGQMLQALETVLREEFPDLVLVYGDTNSTLAGALAAVKLQIPVAHVEAGLRSFRLDMPEEVNRVLTDRISTLLFCPTETAVTNLKNEGFDHFGCRIVNSGDVMYDAVLFYAGLAREQSTILTRLHLSRFALCTIHRAENTDNPDDFKSILAALERINRELPIVLPMHPRTRRILENLSLSPALTIIDPVSYFDMLQLLQNCELVLTDSGGLQKEAYFFGKPCVTLRDETEWIELVQTGANIVAGTDTDHIYSAYQQMLGRHVPSSEISPSVVTSSPILPSPSGMASTSGKPSPLRSPYPSSHNLYGDGHAATIIANELALISK